MDGIGMNSCECCDVTCYQLQNCDTEEIITTTSNLANRIIGDVILRDVSEGGGCWIYLGTTTCSDPETFTPDGVYEIGCPVCDTVPTPDDEAQWDVDINSSGVFQTVGAVGAAKLGPMHYRYTEESGNYIEVYCTGNEWHMRARVYDEETETETFYTTEGGADGAITLRGGSFAFTYFAAIDTDFAFSPPYCDSPCDECLEEAVDCFEIQNCDTSEIFYVSKTEANASSGPHSIGDVIGAQAIACYTIIGEVVTVPTLSEAESFWDNWGVGGCEDCLESP